MTNQIGVADGTPCVSPATGTAGVSVSILCIAIIFVTQKFHATSKLSVNFYITSKLFILKFYNILFICSSDSWVPVCV